MARSRKPPNIVSNACTNADASASIWPPRIVDTALANSENPAPDDLAQAAAARPGRRGEQPDHAAVEEGRHALRGVEEVQRRARRRGVDDDQVPLRRWPRAGRASPSPCTPACRRTTWRWSGRRGWPGSSRRGPGWRGPAPSRRRCGACPASSRAARLARRRAGTPVDAAGLVAQLRQPQRLGQPARRVDREHGDRAARGPPRAAPARPLVVVLPTPPEPQQTTIRIAGSSSSASTSSDGELMPAARRPGPRSASASS